MRTAQTIEEGKNVSGITDSKSESRKRSNANLRPWQPGQSGNPNGRPKNDIAKEIAQAIFSENREEIYAAMGKAILKGNAYAFDVVAQRAFGKLKETIDHNVNEALLERLTSGRKRAAKR